MHRTSVAIGLCGLLLVCPRLDGQQGTVDPARRETVPAMDRAAGSGPRRNVHIDRSHSPRATQVALQRLWGLLGTARGAFSRVA
jgi:hypothetical protein